MKDPEFFAKIGVFFNSQTNSPLPFLQGDPEKSRSFIEICKRLFDLTKSKTANAANDPLLQLFIEGFDDEQIWQQIELLNRTETETSLKGAATLLVKKRDVNLYPRKKQEVAFPEEESENSSDGQENDIEEDLDASDSDAEEDGFHFEESDDEEAGSEHADRGEEFERTEVDDDFFSLRKMEKFLEDEDKKFEKDILDSNGEEIDYFGEMSSSEAESEDDTSVTESKSTRHLLYSDYFADPFNRDQTLTRNTEKQNDNSELNSESTFAEPKKTLSSYEKHQQQIGKKIEILQNKALEPADWQLKGEVKAGSRPENSLLQEMLTFDHVTRPKVDITEEHTQSLESLIKQRILDNAWDDIERKVKPTDDPADFKRRIVLDSSKSKMTLSEIYEQEYLEKNREEKKGEEEEKEDEAHAEIRKEMKDLFRKLDALSNFHFVASLPEPEIKIISNLPAVTMEEVQPVAHSEGQSLAPEEIFEKSAGELKSTTEKDSTDRKRERRKKKLRMKARAKARLDKLKKLDPNSTSVKKIEALHQLKNAAKSPGSNTTILKASQSTAKIGSSQQFFSRLQDQHLLKTSTKKRKG